MLQNVLLLLKRIKHSYVKASLVLETFTFVFYVPVFKCYANVTKALLQLRPACFVS